MNRSSGILMPISALPSPHGIGTLGRAAYDFVDFLHRAGQSVWQMLPLGPTGYGDCPYSAFSSYAGNPYFVDLQELCREGLLEESEVDSYCWGDDPSQVDYGRVYGGRFPLLRKAARLAWEREEAALCAFREENRAWLPDYALYMALKNHFGGQPWTNWPHEGAKRHESKSLEELEQLLREDVELYVFIQYAFFKQWGRLKDYAGSLGIRILGDIPIYVAMDSSDVWAEPEFFCLDAERRPTKVAGVPPDYFSLDGQLWGNPLYNWEYMKETGYAWWLRRIGGACRLFDMIRIDHFRGLESYWAVPYGAETARDGAWQPGPGMELIRAIEARFPDTQIIAEDLGLLTPAVEQLLEDSGYPGMKVLEFAFDAEEGSDYLPHRYGRNCVCYVGTHDNATLAQWLEEASPEVLKRASLYLGLNRAEGAAWGVIRGGISSTADLFVLQMQDALGLGREARMNTPGVAQGNWRWRMLPGAASGELADKLRKYTKLYGR